jgi:hypothetical protein
MDHGVEQAVVWITRRCHTPSFATSHTQRELLRELYVDLCAQLEFMGLLRTSSFQPQ